MPDITVVNLGAVPVYVDADENLNGMDNDEQTLLLVDVANGQTTIVIVDAIRDCDQRHGDEAGALLDRTYPEIEGPIVMIYGFFSGYRFNNAGRLNVRLSNKTGVRLAGLRVPMIR